MDPNETLRRIRSVVSDENNGMGGDRLASLDMLTELFQALDGWITRGGFLPAAWNRTVRAAYDDGYDAAHAENGL